MPGDVSLPVLWSSIETELRTRTAASVPIVDQVAVRPERSGRTTLAGLASAAALAVTVVTVGLTTEPASAPSAEVPTPGYESRIPADDLVVFDFDDPRLLPAANVR